MSATTRRRCHSSRRPRSPLVCRPAAAPGAARRSSSTRARCEWWQCVTFGRGGHTPRVRRSVAAKAAPLPRTVSEHAGQELALAVRQGLRGGHCRGWHVARRPIASAGFGRNHGTRWVSGIPLHPQRWHLRRVWNMATQHTDSIATMNGDQQHVNRSALQLNATHTSHGSRRHRSRGAHDALDPSRTRPCVNAGTSLRWDSREPQ